MTNKERDNAIQQSDKVNRKTDRQEKNESLHKKYENDIGGDKCNCRVGYVPKPKTLIFCLFYLQFFYLNLHS